MLCQITYTTRRRNFCLIKTYFYIVVKTKDAARRTLNFVVVVVVGINENIYQVSAAKLLQVTHTSCMLADIQSVCVFVSFCLSVCLSVSVYVFVYFCS